MAATASSADPVAGRMGLNRATGLPWLVMVKVSPRSTSFSRRGRWVLARKILSASCPTHYPSPKTSLSRRYCQIRPFAVDRAGVGGNPSRVQYSATCRFRSWTLAEVFPQYRVLMRTLKPWIVSVRAE